MSSAHITFDTTGDKIARRVRKMRPSAVRNLFAAATRDDVISLSGGMPAVSLLPEEDIRRATLSAIERPEAREGDAEQIEIAEEKVTEAQEAAAE